MLCRKSLPPALNYITSEEMKQAYKIWPERTATSPSERKLSHYKALLIQDDEEKKRHTSKNILQVHHTMLEATLKTGVIPSRWKTCVSCAILKDPESPKISRLRIVHLYKVDFNLFIKLIWGQKLVHHAEDLNSLGEAQYRSRPNKSCLDIVTRKMFTFNITRLTRHDIITFNTDATSCFN